MGLLSKLAESVTPYAAGEQPRDRKYIKLNTNENPYPPSKMTAEILKAYDAADLRLYPDPESMSLRAVLSQLHGMSTQNIFVGNGSDEVLALAFKTFFDADSQPVVFPDVTYSFYPVFARSCGIRYREIPLNASFQVNVADYIGLNDCGGIVLANPNAPTSIAQPLSEIEETVESNPERVVIIDEAYIDFARTESAVKLIDKYRNLLVVRTFSKSYSLAGMRCGYAVGSAELIDGLTRMKDTFNSYPLDRLCQAVCAAAARDVDYYQTVTNAVVDTRDKMAEKLSNLGFSVLTSQANFLFVTHAKIRAEQLYLSLRERGILVRYFKKPRIENHLRITIGTPKEMNALIVVLKDLIGQLT